MKSRSAAPIVILPFLILFGFIPSLLFFFWIERNCTLPWLPIQLHWPWVIVGDGEVALSALWDFFLIMAFGFIHTLTAQLRVRGVAFGWLPEKFRRSGYIMVAGVTVLLLMGTWQNTGIVVWDVFHRTLWNNLASLGLYLFFMSQVLQAALELDAWEFSGLAAWRSPKAASEEVTLKKTGYYGLIRHPIYFLTLCAVLVTPVLTLDRLVLFMGFFAYLAIGIPIEERKLVAELGEKYREYQNQVPPLFPKLWK